MLKIMGIVLIIGSFTGIGISQRRQFRSHVAVLGEMLSVLDMISNELSFHLASIPDIVRQLAADSRPAVSHIFSAMRDSIAKDDNLSLTFKWMKAFKECGREAGLSEDDIGILCDLSDFIGKYDVQAQQKSIEYARTRLSRQLAVASEELKSKGTVYRTCCVAAGILLVLVLI
ncbi:MAG TPA: stage III sporulation protein AB [Candidatus Butyricicoccus stercorigallinarum]|nr:stage III sporulation protein AB [Candidatus Butyricicoccus stercorigallinarum]